MTIIRYSISAILLAFALNAPSRAADVTYAPGQRVGLVLPAGLAPATTGFSGFTSLDGRTRVAVIELPKSAFASIDTAVKSGQPLPANIKTKPEPFDTAVGKGLLSRETAKEGDKSIKVFTMLAPAPTLTAYVTVQIEEGATNAPSDDAIRTMLASTTVRTEAPVAEQLGLLPYNVTELSNFKTVRTLMPGVAVLMTDALDDTTEGEPYLVISLIPGGGVQPDDRGRVAQQLAATIPGISDVRVTSAEPIRIHGQPGYETRLEATAGTSGAVNVVQWLRFSGGVTMRIIAGAKKDVWPQSFTRFRAVRDGIEPR